MDTTDTEALRQDFLERTGIDLDRYVKTPGFGLVAALNAILDLPNTAVSSLKLAVLLCVIVDIAGLIFLPTGSSTFIWAIAGSVAMLLVAVVLGTVIFLWRIRGSLGAVDATLRFVGQVAVDCSEVVQRRESRTLNPPSVGQTVSTIVCVVLIPQAAELITSRIPLIGKVVRLPVVGALRWWVRWQARQSHEVGVALSNQESFRDEQVDEAIRWAARVGAYCETIGAKSRVLLTRVRRLLLLATVPALLVCVTAAAVLLGALG